MTWFKVDDGWHKHRKRIRAGLDLEGFAARGLWVDAGSWSGDELTDGFIPDDVLDYLAPGIGQMLAKRLEHARLWVRVERGEESGWQFHQWDGHQPTKDEVEAALSKKASGGKLGNHRRWHVEKGKFDDRCPYCREDPDRLSDRSTDRSSDRSSESGANPPTRPDPTRPDNSSPSGEECAPDGTQPTLAGMPASEPPASKTRQKEPPANKAPSAPVSPETEGQRINRVTRTYTDRVKLSNFMGVQGVVRTALKCGDYTEDQVLAGLAVLAENQDPVTNNSLRAAIKPPTWASRDEQGPRAPRQSARHTMRDSRAPGRDYKEKL